MTTTEKRGSEKLLHADSDLCPLTNEEVEQVAGGALSAAWPIRDYFPLGQFPPDLFREVSALNVRIDPGKIDQLANPQIGDRIGNGF